MKQGRKNSTGGLQGGHDRVQGILEDLKRSFLAGTPQRLNGIATALSALARDPEDRTVLDRLRQHFHNISGLAGTHGLPEATELGRRAEVACQRLLETGGAVSEDEIERWRIVHDRFAAIFNRAAGEVAQAAPKATAADDRPIVLLAGRMTRRREMMAALELCGFSTRIADTFDAALAALREAPVSVIVTESALDGGSGGELIERARGFRTGRSIASVILVPTSRFDEKVEAIRCGADACFETTVEVDPIVRRVQHLVALGRLESPRILYVEDDPDHAAFGKRVLSEAGYSVRICADASRFEETFQSFRPELVILDINLSHEVTGHDIARYIRQDERNATLPIIFLTVAGQLHSRIESTSAGGDDQLLKPLSPALLLSIVSARIERARLLNSLLERDGLTGLLTHTAFIERMKTAYADSQRHRDRRRALVLLDIDYFKSVNDQYGHPVGDRVLTSLGALLSRRTRRNDICGRFGGEEFAMIVDDVTVEQAIVLVERILDEFSAIEHVAPDGRSFHVSFSAGVAPIEGNASNDAWRQAADDALYVAKREGRHRVEPARPGGEPVVIPFRKKA